MKQEKLLAIWEYDNFPYLLTGEVERFEGGKPYVPSYQGVINTRCLLPLDVGKTFRTKLRDLEMRRREEMAEVAGRYQRELDALKKEYAVTV